MGATKLSYSLKNLLLTSEEKSFIQACLLGDGTLASSGKYHRLRVTQQIAHAEYVLWKFSQLRRLCVSEPTIDKTNNALRFGTVGHPEISSLHEQWYKPIKQIPTNFRLTARDLAIWFMDDGGRTGKTVNFSVHNFSLESIYVLQYLLQSMNLETKVHSDGKGSRLYIRQFSYPLFKQLVKPYIISCMAYKLP